VISLSSPLLIGIYENHHLIHFYETKEQTSEALPQLFQTILAQYYCRKLFFAKGPGSFMAIKISYVFLRTLSIALKIPLFACDGFVFNDNRPIRAMRTLYFLKDVSGNIETQHFTEEVEQIFTLPKVLNEAIFSDDTTPLYILPAV
jgi:hypothetical protein